MARDIGPKIGIDGESEYKREIESIIQQAKTLDSEMRSVASAFEKEADAKKKNAAVSDQIVKQIQNQKELIAKYADAVEKSSRINGENATSTLKWKQKLYDAQTELNRLNNSLDNTNDKSNKFKEILKAMLTKEAITGTLNVIKDGIEEVGKAAATFGKEVVLAYGEFEQLEGGIKKLFGDEYQEVLKNAQNGFRTAGLSANEYMQTVTSISASLISSLGGNTEEAAKLADRAIQDMSDNANTFGSDMQSIQNAYQGFAKGQYTMLDNLKLGYGGTKTEMERLVLDAENLSATFTAQRDASGKLVLSFADIVTAIGVVQDKMQITGTTAREASGTITGSIESLGSAYKNFVTGLGMNNADIDLLLGNVVESFKSVVNNVQPIIERLIDYIPGIVSAVIPVLQSQAPQLVATATALFNGFVSAIISVLPEVVPVAANAVIMFANTIVQNLPTILDAGMQFILALASGLAEALPTFAQQAPMIIGQFVSSIINNLPQILATGGKIILSLAEGMAMNYMGILEAGWQVMDACKQTFTPLVEAAWSWGRDLIINFANGIIEHTKAVWSSVKEVAQSIWNLLHFSEPEEGPLKNFSTYAPDMMKTFAQGISRNAYLVSDAASQAMQGVSNAMTLGNGTNNTNNFGGFSFVINQQPGQSPQELVDELMYQMQNRIDARKAVFGVA